MPDKLSAPLVNSAENRVLHALISQSELAQWRSPKRIKQKQLRSLQSLLAYAKNYSPFYASRLAHVDVERLSWERFEEIPLLTRQQLRDENSQLDCSKVPPQHEPVKSTMTSGSTASPVEIRMTERVAMQWSCNALRDHLWHGRDASLTMSAIRWRADDKAMAPEGLSFNSWGKPHDQFYQTGESFFLNSSSTIAEQLVWLEKNNPHYLISHPSNLRALLLEIQTQKIQLTNLVQLRTVGEQVTTELRELAREVLDLPLVDTYSSQELGYIALQCPKHVHYHALPDSVVVEILNENGRPCEEGQLGRVVVTSLTNLATPLIRYEVGDMASFGPTCGCGRGLPVLQQLAGRVRNMLRLPDGSLRWPNFGFRKIMDVADIQQFQIVQKDLEVIEFRAVVNKPLSEDQEETVRKILSAHLGHPFAIIFSYPNKIARSKSGKYEDFLSLIEDS